MYKIKQTTFDVIVFLYTALGAVGVGVGIGLLSEAGAVFWFGWHTDDNFDALLIMGCAFVLMGLFMVWFVRFWANFWR